MLRALVALIFIAAVLRAAVLVRSVPAPSATQFGGELRQVLGLPGSHRLRQLVAAELSPQTGWAAAWIDDASGAAAIVPDGTGRLRISRDQATVMRLVDGMDRDALRGLDVSAWPPLPEPVNHLTLWLWDAEVPVYVTAGPDGQPGIAGFDDDGDGVIDNLGELGATGSDDQVVAPHQSGYLEAATGGIISRVISRGALVMAEGELQLPPRDAAEGVKDAPAEVWLEFTSVNNASPDRARAALPVRISLQVDWGE